MVAMDNLRKIHTIAKQQFDDIQSAVRDGRMQSLQDRRFYSIAGAQWEGSLGEQFANKPKLEVNKIALAVTRIINEYRNNRITVDFISKDGGEDKLSDTCNKLYRADEQDSGAEEAYDNAFEEAVGGGFGAWRMRTCYENEDDDEDERQRINIEPIFDADSCVYFDLNAKRQDKADAKHCFVLTAMTEDAYIEEWGDDPSTWDKAITQSEFDWVTEDAVYVAEYYKVEEHKETVYVFVTLDGTEERYTEQDFIDDPELFDQLEAVGTKRDREKKVRRVKVHKYIMSGLKVLEDCGIIAGKHIPIVPVYGKRWFIDGIERCAGHVRGSKDAQRLANMQRSKLAELSALSSTEKPILMPEQIAGHQKMWADDNISNYPYLLVNPITDANGQMMATGPIGYTKPPMIPPAMAALLQITEQDLKDMLGNQDGGDEIVSNISGKAVELIQQRLDMQTFIYMSNFAKGVRRAGDIWLSMAKDVYVETGRKMKGIDNSNEASTIELMRPGIDSKGVTGLDNDLSKADFDVVVDVGPSSSSKRQATVRALTGMMQITQDPETMQVLSAMTMMNMEGEGIKDVRGYFRKKLLTMGVVDPSEEEAAEMAKAEETKEPDANTEFLQSAAREADAKAVKARADTVLTVAKATETKANTIKTLADVDNAEKTNAMQIIKEFGNQPL
jgi:hypothetical protein